MLDNALGVRKTPEKMWIQVSWAVTIGLCGKHELPEEIHESGLFPTDRKLKAARWSMVGSYSSPHSRENSGSYAYLACPFSASPLPFLSTTSP